MLSRFCALALTSAVLFAATGAHATTLDLGTVSGGQSGMGTSYSNVSTSFTDTLQGTLSPNSEITFTYSYTGFSPSVLTLSGTGSNNAGQAYATVAGLNQGGTLVSGTSNQGATVSGLPIVVTANLTPPTGKGVTTIDNTSNAPISFSSVFQNVALLGSTGSLSSTFVVSSVPIPATILLFVSGLLIMAGFAAYKRQASYPEA